MIIIISMLIFFSTCMHAQQSLAYRNSMSGLLPNRYFDPDARRISLTVTTPPSEHIRELPDITHLPFAFPESTPTPASPTHTARFQYTPNKPQAPALTTQPDKKIAQKKSLFFCCSLLATKKQ